MILWWHWVAFGLVLLLLELLSGTFFILTLGIAAIIVGIVSFLMLLSFNWELSLWIVLLLIGIFIWYRRIRKSKRSKVGQSDYALNTIGTVIKKIEPNGRGEVAFDTPVLGNSTLIATSDEAIDVGKRVKIVKVKGQLIEVRRVDG